MRLLIWVPVIHNYVDMGLSKDEAFANEHLRKLNLATDRLWDIIGLEIARLDLDYNDVQIYMDSWVSELTIRDAEVIAVRGSRNFQLIVQYVWQGAKLMSTENIIHFFVPNFLIQAMDRRPNEFYWFWKLRMKIIMMLSYFYNKFDPIGLARSNLNLRDQYVARKIETSLEDNKTGILFMGALHNVTDYITAKDIKVVILPAVVLEVYRLRAEFNLWL